MHIRSHDPLQGAPMSAQSTVHQILCETTPGLTCNTLAGAFGVFDGQCEKQGVDLPCAECMCEADQW